MEAKSKEHIPFSDLEEIKRVVKEKKKDVEIREDYNSIIIEEGSKKIEINKDGTIQGSMPFHSFHTHKADSLKIEENDIEIHYDDGVYVFKI